MSPEKNQNWGNESQPFGCSPEPQKGTEEENIGTWVMTRICNIIKDIQMYCTYLGSKLSMKNMSAKQL